LFIIVGLGNPGHKYEKTRHNVGFMVLDELSSRYNISFKEKDIYMIANGVLEGVKVILLKPLTFMNKSGIALKKLIQKIAIDKSYLATKLIVIHDDLDIDIGNIKIKKDGSSGGHKGVESIINEIGTKDFIRVKVGIGRPETVSVEDYVLSNFKISEKKIINDVIIKTSDAIVSIITEGLQKAMNKYNQRKGMINNVS
jgi:PTH1 family peptidyl-tRNA hydrolase